MYFSLSILEQDAGDQGVIYYLLAGITATTGALIHVYKQLDVEKKEHQKSLTKSADDHKALLEKALIFFSEFEKDIERIRVTDKQEIIDLIKELKAKVDGLT